MIPVLPDIGRIHTFWASNQGTSVGTVGGVTSTALANLAVPLHALEGLNVWLTGDFRFVPANALRAGVLAGMAFIVLAFALVSALRRRDLVWPAAMLALGAIYLYTLHRQSPYVASKALTIPAPLLVLGCGAALMRWLDAASWRSLATVAVAVGSIFYLFFAFQSSYMVLANAQVGPTDHVDELRSLRPLLHNRPTLVLFYDDYTQWELLGVPTVSSTRLGSPIPAPIQPVKPWTYGQPIDFDSVDAATLDRFDYVITTRTTHQSEPPPNFHLVGSSRSYEVWQRIGPTRPRGVLPESGQPGAILDCGKAAGRRLSRERGVARVRPQPRSVNVAPLAPGGSEQLGLSLPPGTWDLSLPFVSPQAVTVRGGGLDVRLPPNLDRSGRGLAGGHGPKHRRADRADRDDGRPVADLVGQLSSSRRSRWSRCPECPPAPFRYGRRAGEYVDWYELS